MSDAEFGLLTSVFLWVYGGLSPFAGFLADRFQRSRVIIVSVFVWSAVTLLTSQAKTLHQLLFTRALMGISEACYLPAALALITDYHRGSTRSLATGLHLSGLMWVALSRDGRLARRATRLELPCFFGSACGRGLFHCCSLFVLRDPRRADVLPAIRATARKFFGCAAASVQPRIILFCCWFTGA